MKKLFSLFLFIASVPCFAQVTVTVNWSKHIPAPNSDTIYYNPSRKLSWPDFKGKPGNPADALAITSSGLGYFAAMQYYNGKTQIVVDVYCYFSKQNSWVRQGRESEYALTHEQHHFDVTYIVTNLFIQKLKTAAFTRNNYGTIIEKLYNESCRELEKMQNDYDGQTKNGQLRNIQAEWNEKITNQLKEL